MFWCAPLLAVFTVMLPRVAWLDEWSEQPVCMMWLLIGCWPEHGLSSDWERERERVAHRLNLPSDFNMESIVTLLCITFVCSESVMVWTLFCCYFYVLPNVQLVSANKGQISFSRLVTSGPVTRHFLSLLTPLIKTLNAYNIACVFNCKNSQWMVLLFKTYYTEALSKLLKIVLTLCLKGP